MADNRRDDATTPDANRDPITGEAGAHPVGAGLGAAAGGAAAGAAGVWAWTDQPAVSTLNPSARETSSFFI